MKLNILKLFLASGVFASTPALAAPQWVKVAACTMPIAFFQRSITENEKPTVQTA